MKTTLNREKTQFLEQEIKGLRSTLAEKTQTIQTLREKLIQTETVNRSLNQSFSHLNQKVEVYLQKIGYEREKLRQRTELFAARELELTAEIETHQKTIALLTDKYEKTQDMLLHRDKAIEHACSQFKLTQESLETQLDRAKGNEQLLATCVSSTQKEIRQLKTQLQQAEARGEASQEIIKSLQQVISGKDVQLGKEKVRFREVEHRDEQLAATIALLENELRNLKKLQQAEELRRLKTEIQFT